MPRRKNTPEEDAAYDDLARAATRVMRANARAKSEREKGTDDERDQHTGEDPTRTGEIPPGEQHEGSRVDSQRRVAGRERRGQHDGPAAVADSTGGN